MLNPSCGLCPGITEMLSGTVAPLRQHETHTGGGSSNSRQSPCRPMSNSHSQSDLHHDSDTSRMSRAEANLGFVEGRTGNVKGPLNAAHCILDKSDYLMKYGRFASYPEAAGCSSYFGG